MSIAMARYASFDNINDIFESSLHFEEKTSKVVDDFVNSAVNLCRSMVLNGSFGAPRSIWDEYGPVSIAPSIYDFQHQIDDSECVVLEEEDLPLRDYCQEALSSLRTFANLKAGWDGEFAPEPLAAGLDDAFTFLRVLSANFEHCKKAISMLDHEGIPSLAFENDSTYCSVAFYGEEVMVFYYFHRITSETIAKTMSWNDEDDVNFVFEKITSL
ncbi:hypothetical protein [Pseudomonas fulva]|uniref:hypothetical protein n=1 Tax=Pseudomonas fulva TaxID=47880 RepID=UPI0015E314ED|nr:hypothetical protein [Pseudomonas fulva]MBA1209813.1 hypothetical protein [Pseudomonas fulva]